METKVKCPLCNNTGIAKYFDVAKYSCIPNGSYLLSDLIDKYGKYSLCPDCIKLS
jgi:hypothetical protein